MALSTRTRTVLANAFSDAAAGKEFADKCDAAGALSNRTQRVLQSLIPGKKLAFDWTLIVAAGNGLSNPATYYLRRPMEVLLGDRKAAQEIFTQLA